MNNNGRIPLIGQNVTIPVPQLDQDLMDLVDKLPQVMPMAIQVQILRELRAMRAEKAANSAVK